MKQLVILILVVLGSAAVGQDKRSDGNELLRWCRLEIRTMDTKVPLHSPEMFEGAYCLGLITGVSDMLDLCGDPTYGQQVRVVVKFLDDHPEVLHLRATTLVKHALLGAFACVKSK